MKYEIKHRFTGKVLYSADVGSERECVVRAVKEGSDLQGANLQGANLQGTNLWGADLRDAYLQDANLRCANLQDANLEGANLQGTNLWGADLRGAYLRGANLEGANLRCANLQGANLQGADLRDADLPNFSIVPEEGEFIAYKKLVGGVIATLLIPSEAKRTSSLIGRKCRAEFVKVLELSNGENQAKSDRQGLIYTVGEIVRPDSFDPDIRVECTNGIHFFITRKEAEEYNL